MNPASSESDIWVRTAYHPDGAVQVSTGWNNCLNARAVLAEKVLLALVGTNVLSGCVDDSPRPKSASELAKFACDVAHEMRMQQEARDWLIPLPQQEFATHLRTPKEVA